MKCDQLLRELTEHREGVLGEDLCAAIDRHLRECAPCGDVQRDLEDLSRLCRQSAVPAALPAPVRARIEQLLRDAR